MDGWDKKADGIIDLHPVMGWQTADAAGINPVLQIEYAADPDALRMGAPSRLQVVMTVAQARAIDQALLRMADQCERKPFGPAS